MKKFFALASLVVLPVLLAVSLAACGEQKRELYVYNWSEYLPDAVLELFEQEKGITVHYATYDSNEAMYAKLSSLGGEGYDVIFPSTYFVQRMRQEGLLRAIDKSLIPNMANLDPSLLDKPYDPNNEYSVPYLWGTTGIGVNTDKIDPASVTSLKDLLKPEYKDALYMTDDIREVFGMALKILGYSVNETDPEHIKEAYELLAGMRGNIKVFSESPSSVLLAGEANLGLIWNGELYLADAEAGPREGGSQFVYIYPEEGVNVWMDNMAIPSGAKNVAEAHEFIDFLLRPDIASLICAEVGYSTPNLKAIPLMPEDLKDNPILFPTPDDMKNSEFLGYIGDAILTYEQYWERLKTGQ